MKYRVFKYISKTTGEIYAGVTGERYQSHMTGKNGRKFRGKFKEAIERQGFSDFKYRVIEEDLPSREEAYKVLDDFCEENNAFPITSPQRRKYFTNHAKRVCQLSLEGKLLAIYPSVSEAARQTGFRQSNISSVINRRMDTTGGYKWVSETEWMLGN